MNEKVYDNIIIGTSYRGGPTLFSKMRRALALAADIPVTHMLVDIEDGDTVSLEVPDLDGYDLVEANIYGDWDTPPPDPILYLLAHSDEKGVIREEHILDLIARIVELEPIAHAIISEREGVEEATILSQRFQVFARQLAHSFDMRTPVEFRLEPYFK